MVLLIFTFTLLINLEYHEKNFLKDQKARMDIHGEDTGFNMGKIG